MDRQTNLRRTPDMEDIFSTEVQSRDAPGLGRYSESGAVGRRTPDLDEIFESNIMDSGQQSPDNEGIADRRGMAVNQYSIILTCYSSILFPAGTPNMDDLWNQPKDQQTGPAGTRA